MLSQNLESCHGTSVPRSFIGNALWACLPTCAMVKHLEEVHHKNNHDFFKCEDIHGVFMLTHQHGHHNKTVSEGAEPLYLVFI